MPDNRRFVGVGLDDITLVKGKRMNFPQCGVCKNIISMENQTCKAFPKGIPDELFGGDVMHTKPYKGDNGILFEAKESVKEK